MKAGEQLRGDRTIKEVAGINLRLHLHQALNNDFRTLTHCIFAAFFFLFEFYYVLSLMPHLPHQCFFFN